MTTAVQLSGTAPTEIAVALWLYVDGQEGRLLQSLQISPAARRLALDDPYDLLWSISEPVDGQLARVICESPLVVLIPAPELVSQRVTAAQDIARALNVREAAKDAIAEICRMQYP